MSNKEAIKQYDIKKYRTPDGYTSDIAVFTIVSDKTEEYKPPIVTLKLMLIKRSELNSEGNTNIEAGKWALPGGFVQDNESAFDAAKRELEEETGYVAGDITYLQSFATSPGFADEIIHLYVAKHLSVVEEKKQLDEDEFVELLEVTLEEAEQLVAEGKIYDAKTAFAIIWLKLYLSKETR